MSEPSLPLYGFIKPALDAHTLGINAAAELLKACGHPVIFADETVSSALNDFRHESRRRIVVDWILQNGIRRLGISYRLDPVDAVNMVGFLLEDLKQKGMMSHQGGSLESVSFGGLPGACQSIDREFRGQVRTFSGGETVRETLLRLGVDEERIPADIAEGSKYDDTLAAFGKRVIEAGDYKHLQPVDRSGYPDFGTRRDTVVKRIDANMKRPFSPLVRAHVGPYSAAAPREESVREFLSWSKTLADSRFLDMLSIGSSQLTQSNFGEDWGDKTNGGGVPVNSPHEYEQIWEAARPMLVRTYAGTRNIPDLARMHEQTLNICWHALSLWWFNKLDDRGPYDLYTNLQQHLDAIRYIASTGKPFEANVPHHFAFRGADDVTYVVSAYLSAKLAKRLGIRTYILQNMLNTPRFTWGVQDLSKSRAILRLVKELEDANFRIFLQPRAGLDYFKPDLHEAKIQLAAVTALMDDIDPHDETSPPIIHVVSYSEASHLATPDVINESIQITQHALSTYRKLRREGKVDDMSHNAEVTERMNDLVQSARTIIQTIEKSIDNPYSAEGFYKLFAAGFLPVPYLWGEVDEFRHARNWTTQPVKGGVKVVDDKGKPMTAEHVAAIATKNLKDAEYRLNQQVIRRLKAT